MRLHPHDPYAVGVDKLIERIAGHHVRIHRRHVGTICAWHVLWPHDIERRGFEPEIVAIFPYIVIIILVYSRF